VWVSINKTKTVKEADEAYAELLEWCGAVANGFTSAILIGYRDDADAYVADWRWPSIAPRSTRSSSARVWQCTRQWHVDSMLKLLKFSAPTNEWRCVLIQTEPSANVGVRAASCIVMRADGATRVVRCGTSPDRR